MFLPVPRTLKKKLALLLSVIFAVQALAVLSCPLHAQAAASSNLSMYRRCVQANSPTGWCLVISKSKHQAVVYKKSGNRWKQYATFCVTVGRNRCTASGTFSIENKYYCRDMAGSTVFYCMTLGGRASGYLHSTLYKKGSRNINTAISIDRRLGIDASKGCVRFYRWNAYFLYYTLPRRTRVVIF